MTSQRKIEANRRNALLSTGPVTPEGKARSRWNGVKHGLRGANILIPGEDPEIYLDHVSLILQDLDPHGPVEVKLAHRVADCMWLLDRAASYQSAVVANSDYRDEMLTDLTRLTGYEYRIERSMLRCLRELRVLRAERDAGRREPVPPEIWRGDQELTRQLLEEGPGLQVPCFPDLPRSEQVYRDAIIQRARNDYRAAINTGDTSHIKHLLREAEMSLMEELHPEKRRELDQAQGKTPPPEDTQKQPPVDEDDGDTPPASPGHRRPPPGSGPPRFY